jgi:hypothetical protein
MDVCVRLFCIYAVLCVGSGLATDWSRVKGVLPIVNGIKKLEKRSRSNRRTVEPYIYKYKTICFDEILYNDPLLNWIKISFSLCWKDLIGPIPLDLHGVFSPGWNAKNPYMAETTPASTYIVSQDTWT